MSSIHYKFRSSTEYDTVTFDGQSITLNDLRESIMLQKKIVKSPAYTLEITNAQTKEVYEDDDAMVAKNSSVIVKRVPVQRLAAVTDGAGLSKEEELLTEEAFARLTTTPDLVGAKASEDDKIKAMMKQSTEDFDPSQYLKRAPPHYICHRCGAKGQHYVKSCPTAGDPRYNRPANSRAPSGIPREYFLLKMKQEEELIRNLRAMQDKSSRFSPVVSSEVVDHTKVPENLQCPHCKKLFTDAVVTPCCGESYCDECIRTYLVDNDCKCKCGETTSPDNLIANKSLRTTVNNFRNQKQEEMKSVPTTQPHQNGPSSIIENQLSPQPASVSESTEVQVQQPPDLHSESSQSSITNGALSYNNVPSPQVVESSIMDSPKKPLLEKEDIKPTIVNPPMPHVVSAVQPTLLPGSIAPSIVQGSQAFPGAAGTAIYTHGVNSHAALRPSYILPQHLQQQIIGPGGLQYGVNLPAGATIIKRIVPVPVGPRLVPQIAQHGTLPANIIPMDFKQHASEQRSRSDGRSKRDKSDKLESPMPMTEEEFYLWQKQIKSGSRPTRERYRSCSRSPTDRRRRHKSVSPDPSKVKYDSTEDSSQERPKKREKSKRRHRDSSQESLRSDSSKLKARADKKYNVSKKVRHLPKHIKRELEEFEFDNEIEFDEELRKLRKLSKNRNSDSLDEELLSPKSDLDVSSLSRTSDTEHVNDSTIDDDTLEKDLSENSVKEISQKDDVVKGPEQTTMDTENQVVKVEETVQTPTDPDVKPKRKTRIVKKIVKRKVKMKKSEAAMLALKSSNIISISSTTDEVSSSIVKEKVISTNDLQTDSNEAQVEAKLQNEHVNHENKQEGEDQNQDISNEADDRELPENSKWVTGINRETSEQGKPVRRKPLNGNKNLITKKLKPESKFTADSKSVLQQKKHEAAKKALQTKKEDDVVKDGKPTEADKAKLTPEELKAKKDAYRRTLIEKAKRALVKDKAAAKTPEDEERIRKREKYILTKEKQFNERLKMKAKKESKEEISSNKKKTETEDSDENNKLEWNSFNTHPNGSKKPDQSFYKPGDAKLKSISEMAKKSLKIVSHKKPSDLGSGDEILKSKVTSIKKIVAPEKSRRVIKTSVSEEEKEYTVGQSSEDHYIRRVVKVNTKNSSKDRSREQLKYKEDERRRHEKSSELARKESVDRDRFERRRLREEDDHRRQRELERERLERLERKRKKAEKEKEESLQREKETLREKERLERKLQKERQLREELMREKEEDERQRRKREREKEESLKRRRVVLKDDDRDSDRKRTKRDHRGDVINIDVSDQSQDDSESSDEEQEREKKHKKKSRKKKERKKKRKRKDSEDSDDDESADSSDDEEEEEERKSKKKKKKTQEET